MTNEELDAIEARANAATKGSTGVWSREVYEDGEQGEGPYGVHPGGPGPMVETRNIVVYETSGEITVIADVHRPEDAAFLVAAQPSVVLALVAKVRRLESDNALQADALMRWREMTGCATPHAAREAIANWRRLAFARARLLGKLGPEQSVWRGLVNEIDEAIAALRATGIDPDVLAKPPKRIGDK